MYNNYCKHSAYAFISDQWDMSHYITMGAVNFNLNAYAPKTTAFKSIEIIRAIYQLQLQPHLQCACFP